ncbi:3-hydroxybutyrate dehydrogenase type 2-like [Anneissia japonica]|uniref:3-hydroxybutyrate dehydrogenase type 2-like n=1 Tax=Anneissia japonica TaxID=1529436 RepID=UPI0014256354|nr:3-hydroxybutyrate dehydrogenase type 2-like [Anneissia japonica]
MNRLAGKIAIVTAAANGIGRATAQAFAREGATVYASDIDMDKLNELRGDSKIEVHKLDVTNNQDILALSKKVDKVDILFNCAAIVYRVPILDLSEEMWDKTFDINIKSMFRMCKEFMPKMIASGGGSIINVSSVSSSIRAVQNRCAYSSTKGAVLAFSKTIAVDYVNQGIRCNTICPGTIDSPSIRAYVNSCPDPEKALKDIAARQPIGRLGKSEEVANMGVFLASDESAFITGSEFRVDGGWTM